MVKVRVEAVNLADPAAVHVNGDQGIDEIRIAVAKVAQGLQRSGFVRDLQRQDGPLRATPNLPG